jgi:hypothetical protein
VSRNRNGLAKTGGRFMIKIIHPVAGAVAILTIATFWLSTALSELFGSTATIVAVKYAVPWGFLLEARALRWRWGGGPGWWLGKSSACR